MQFTEYIFGILNIIKVHIITYPLPRSLHWNTMYVHTVTNNYTIYVSDNM
jgi:hypothetical protein